MTYPEDVLVAAREAAAKYWGELHLAEPDAGWDGFADCALKGEFDGDAEVQSACIAIMAERQRCAEIAEISKINSRDPVDLAVNHTCECIRDAILGQQEPVA